MQHKSGSQIPKVEYPKEKNNSQLQPNSNLSLPPAPGESLHGPPWNSGPPNMRHRKSLLPSILRAPANNLQENGIRWIRWILTIKTFGNIAAG